MSGSVPGSGVQVVASQTALTDGDSSIGSDAPAPISSEEVVALSDSAVGNVVIVAGSADDAPPGLLPLSPSSDSDLSNFSESTVSTTEVINAEVVAVPESDDFQIGADIITADVSAVVPVENRPTIPVRTEGDGNAIAEHGELARDMPDFELKEGWSVTFWQPANGILRDDIGQLIEAGELDVVREHFSDWVVEIKFTAGEPVPEHRLFPPDSPRSVADANPLDGSIYLPSDNEEGKESALLSEVFQFLYEEQGDQPRNIHWAACRLDPIAIQEQLDQASNAPRVD